MTIPDKNTPVKQEPDLLPARTAARMAAVQALYQMDLAGTDVNDVIDEFLRLRMSSDIADGDDPKTQSAQGADRVFFADILRGVLRRSAKSIRWSTISWRPVGGWCGSTQSCAPCCGRACANCSIAPTCQRASSSTNISMLRISFSPRTSPKSSMAFSIKSRAGFGRPSSSPSAGRPEAQ